MSLSAQWPSRSSLLKYQYFTCRTLRVDEDEGDSSQTRRRHSVRALSEPPIVTAQIMSVVDRDAIKLGNDIEKVPLTTVK